jgi:hypothetical protein
MSGAMRTPEQIAVDDAAAKQKAAADKAAADKAAAAQITAKDKAAVVAAEADVRESRRLASQGAQVVLHPDSEAAIGARGGASDTISGNIEHRDAALVAAGFDPVAPSAQNTDRPADAKPLVNTVPARDTADSGRVRMGAGMIQY